MDGGWRILEHKWLVGHVGSAGFLAGSRRAAESVEKLRLSGSFALPTWRSSLANEALKDQRAAIKECRGFRFEAILG